MVFPRGVAVDQVEAMRNQPTLKNVIEAWNSGLTSRDRQFRARIGHGNFREYEGIGMRGDVADYSDSP